MSCECASVCEKGGGGGGGEERKRGVRGRK
jgi:hypothetical protein